MDSNIQIQTLKSQIENMKLQIDNISMQNNNMFMMNAPIGGQLINLSMQMLNTGIQTFNIGKTMMMDMNMDNFYEQLKKVSEQINTMINEYKIQQQMMLQQQMMIQQQIMLQQQMAMQNQMMMQQQIKENQNQLNDNGKSEYINIKFDNPNKENLALTFKSEIKVKEALNKYIERIYGYPNDKIYFVYNAKKIYRNELRTIGEFFNYFPNVSIQVLEFGNVI